MRRRAGLALCAAVVAFGLAGMGGGAQARVRPAALVTACGTPPCYTEFTVDGNPPAGTVALLVFNTGGDLQVQLMNSGSIDLSPAIGTDDSIHLVLNVGTLDPVVFGTTGVVTLYSVTATHDGNLVTIDLKPSAASWNSGGCSVVSCGSDVNPVTATNDFASVAIGVISSLSTATDAVRNEMRGTWFSTNAQSFTNPTFDAGTGKASFTVAAPHFKADGTTVNSGFFRFFAPDALVEAMGIADPTTVTSGAFAITSSAGTSTAFDVTHEDAPAGVLIQTTAPFNYSSPTFTVAKAHVVTRTLTVTKVGPGSGSVTSSPDGVDCGSTCSHGFDDGTEVTLTATAAAGSTFTGWSGGGCSGTGSCSTTVHADTAVTATFVVSPTIASFAPPSGGAHATVTVIGTGLGGAKAVNVHGTSAAFAVVSGTKITFTVPAGATSGPVQVITSGGTATSAAGFTVLPGPAISGFGPGSGGMGTVVTVTGTNLDGVLGVQLGTTLLVPTTVSATQVTFTVPAGAVSGHIKLFGAAGSATSAGTFTVTGP